MNRIRAYRLAIIFNIFAAVSFAILSIFSHTFVSLFLTIGLWVMVIAQFVWDRKLVQQRNIEKSVRRTNRSFSSSLAFKIIILAAIIVASLESASMLEYPEESIWTILGGIVAVLALGSLLTYFKKFHDLSEH